jgi:mono/diheme cytochrome c family protein
MTRTLFNSRRVVPRAFVLTVAGLALAGGVASGCGSSNKAAVAPTTTVPATTSPTTTVQPTTTAGGQVAAGAQIFANNCESCHGQMGAGGHVGPNLQKSPVAGHLALVEKQVRNGGGAMPPFSGVLSAKDIDAVAHYVVEQIAPKA